MTAEKSLQAKFTEKEISDTEYSNETLIYYSGILIF